MKIRDLRWYIMGCIVLLISFCALSMCLYLPIKGKIVNSIKELSKENLVMNLDFTEEAINNYYNQFINGNYQSIETEFNKTKKSRSFRNGIFYFCGNYSALMM